MESDISDEEACTGWKRGDKAKWRTRLLSSDSSPSEKLNGEETTYTDRDALSRNIELLTDLAIEENRLKKINPRSSRSSDSVDGDDELSKNGELPADMVSAKRRRRKRIKVQQCSSSSESAKDETELGNTTPSELYFQKYSSPPSLDDLPDEILNRILAKVIIKKIRTEMPASSLTEVDSKQAISRLRVRLKGVSANWNDCLSSEWFADILDSTVNQLVPPIQSVALEFVAKLECSNVVAVTTLNRKVYILDNESCCTVRIYEDVSPPEYLSEIDFDHIRNPTDIAACATTNVLYLGGNNSIWRIPAGNIHDDKNVEPWMEDVENLDTFSVTADGRLLIPRNKPFDHVGVYDGNAQLIDRIFLPACASYPGHVVEKPNGNVILSHNFSFSLSELNPTGRFVHRYKFRRGESLLEFRGFLFNHFVLDACERVIAVNVNGQEIVCVDPTLRQVEVVARKDTYVVYPTRVHYDKVNSRLIVVGLDSIAFLNVLNPLTCG